MTEPFAKAEMLVRKPAAEVFEAFVNPDITTRFWFTHSNGRLDENKQLEWAWKMYDVIVPVMVLAVEKYERILIEWGNHGEATKVEWNFTPVGEKGTLVSIVNTGFKGSENEILAQVRDSTEGFALVLAGLKALLEHNIELKLVGDRFPDNDVQ